MYGLVDRCSAEKTGVVEAKTGVGSVEVRLHNGLHSKDRQFLRWVKAQVEEHDRGHSVTRSASRALENDQGQEHERFPIGEPTTPVLSQWRAQFLLSACRG